MSTAKHAADSKTAQRLRSRRLLVVAADGARAEALARALRHSGAAAVAIAPDSVDHAAAHALDADVMLVNEDEPEPCRPLVVALRQHPRTRWTTVLPVSFAALWRSGGEQPEIAELADEVSRLATSLMELTVRARGRLPHHAALEPVGPSRLLRALDSSGRALRVTLSDGRMGAELDLVEGRIYRARVVIMDSNQRLVDAEALAAMLAMRSGHLRIDEREKSGRPSWNVPLLVALEQAAALVSIASEQPLIPSGSGIRPAISERLASLDPQAAAASAANFKPTVPQIAVSEALAEAARIAFDADSAVPEHAAASGESAVAESGDLPVGEGADSAVGQSGRPSEGAGALRADRDETTRMVEAPAWESAPPFEGSSSSTAPLRVQRPAARLFVGLAGLAAMGAIAAAFLSCPPTQHSRRQPAPASAVARTATAAVPAAQLPPPAIEAPVIAVPAPKPPSRSELKHARRIAKRGDGYLRNDRPLTAAEAYLKALAIAPDYVPAIRPLAQIHLQRGNASEARRWTEHLAALEPDSAINQLLLGDAYALSDDQPRATEAWQRASTLGSAAARKRLAQQR